MVKNLPVTQETWVRSLVGEDPLEKEMATHSSIFAHGNPMDRGAWWSTVQGVARVGFDCMTKQQSRACKPGSDRRKVILVGTYSILTLLKAPT